MVLRFYKNLFKEENLINPSSSFPIVDETFRFDLLKNPSRKEVKQAIFVMGATKTLKIDGLLVFLFQKNWPLVGKNIIRLVREVFDRDNSLEVINKTLVVLIP